MLSVSCASWSIPCLAWTFKFPHRTSTWHARPFTATF